jgi:hypothetical protein
MLKPRECVQDDASLHNVTAALASTPAADLARIANILNGKQGTQITKSSMTYTGGTVVIYTVPTGKVFYLSAASCSSCGISASGRSILYVQNLDDSEVYRILDVSCVDEYTPVSDTIAFPYPIAIPAGYDVVRSCDANLISMVFFHGWLENA